MDRLLGPDGQFVLIQVGKTLCVREAVMLLLYDRELCIYKKILENQKALGLGPTRIFSDRLRQAFTLPTCSLVIHVAL